jgi:hypothetical protein
MEKREKRVKKKRLTLRRLIKDGEEIWVRNATGDAENDVNPGIVVFQVGKGAYIDKVSIPPGDDPVCITDQVDPESLQGCTDLFKLVNSGALDLLEPEYAEEYYEANETRREAVAKKIKKFVNRTVEKPIVEEKFPGEKKKQKARNTKKVHPKVENICLQAKHQKISETDALEALLEQSKVFKESDYAYLMQKGKFESVKSWAKEQLEK